MKVAQSSPKGQKTLWEKEKKILITSNFSFYNSFLKRIVLQTRKKQGLVCKGLNMMCTKQFYPTVMMTPKHFPKQNCFEVLPVF